MHRKFWIFCYIKFHAQEITGNFGFSAVSFAVSNFLLYQMRRTEYALEILVFFYMKCVSIVKFWSSDTQLQVVQVVYTTDCNTLQIACQVT